jgi:triphosphatase
VSASQSARARTIVPTETELKLALPPEAAARIARHPLVLAIKRAPAKKSRLTSTYFDTEDRALAAAGIALRLRRDGRRWLQTVKGHPDEPGAGGMTSRAEYEWPVAGARLDPMRFATTQFRRALGRAERRGLVAQCTTDFTRTTIPLTFADSSMARLCVDVGEVRAEHAGQTARAPICEIELEMEAGDASRLYEFAHALAADVPMALEPKSKAERGFALHHPVVAAPVRASEARLGTDAAAAEAFAAVIRVCLAQIEGNAHGVLAADHPEWIHQMRIGVRRLRACLSLSRRSMAPARLEPMRVELRWLAHALGPARDLDVFTLETLPAFTAAVARSSTAALKPALHALATQAAAHRVDARAAARAAVASNRFLRLVLAAAALAASPGGGAASTDLSEPACDVVRPLLKRRHRALLALGTDLAHAAPESRHAARLAGKKLRYATEFFAPLFPRERTAAYRNALAGLQEEMGAWNDAAVAAQLAAGLAGADSPAAAAFSGWAAAQGSARAAALEAAWRAFARAKPFWARD